MNMADWREKVNGRLRRFLQQPSGAHVLAHLNLLALTNLPQPVNKIPFVACWKFRLAPKEIHPPKLPPLNKNPNRLDQIFTNVNKFLLFALIFSISLAYQWNLPT